jgi:hypothetical protein
MLNFLTWKRAELRRFQARAFVFIVESQADRRKVLQVVFGNDGSIYASFPYFDDDRGIIGMAALSELSSTTNVKLESTGKVTSNKVKYSHHASGRVQFSGTGKVRTVVKKVSPPLAETVGHIFTLSAQGLAHFESDPKSCDRTPSLARTELTFRFDQLPTDTVKLVARWHDYRSLMSRARGTSLGPIVQGQLPDGRRSPMFLVGPPRNSPLAGFVLVVNCEPIPALDKVQPSTMMFIGGFGKPQESLLYQTESFLFAHYPVATYRELAKRLESVDIASR